MDYPALRVELLTDPVALGYTGKTDQEAADLLNSLTTGRTVPRTNITKNEVLRNIANADYPSTSAGDQIKWQKLNLLLSTDTIDASSQNIRDVFTAIFTGTSGGTLGRLNTLSSTVVSRAVELRLGTVSALDVNLARNNTW